MSIQFGKSAAVSLLSLSLTLLACGPQDEHGDLPSMELADNGDVTDETGVTTQELAAGRPIMRIPFRCGQQWEANTYSGHSPTLAVDWNRADDLGDAVLASAGGTVSRSESEGNTSYGNWIEITHANGYRTRYAHLSVRGVGVGARVTMGQKIGEVGNTGGSSGPHLHYEQIHNGSTIRVILGEGTAVRYFERRVYKSGNGC